MKKNLKSYPLTTMNAIIAGLGIEAYRSQQIFQWIWQKGAIDFSSMSNISKNLRKLLSDEFTISGLKTERVLSAEDGTKKFLFQDKSDNYIEAVFIPERKRKTVCVSSQVGCPLGCTFCATALLGFRRNMKAYEIADEIQLIQKDSVNKITNIVFMGMGEPLLNIKEVVSAIEIISSPIGLSISQRHTTISTVGLIKGIEFLLNSTLKVKLAISLNFPDKKVREELMPVAKQNPLKEILKLAKEYSSKKNMVTFEYVIIDRVNDCVKDAERLLILIKGIPSKINLIPYNPHPSLPYRRPSVKKIERFHQYLLSSRHTITLRKSRGQEIFAGCGQLAGDTTIKSI